MTGFKVDRSILPLAALAFLFGYINDFVLTTPGKSLQNRYMAAQQTIASWNATHSPTTTTQNNTIPFKRNITALPSFAKGGIIVFLHIPKTGGTTIRKGFQRRKGISYMFSNRRSKYEELVTKINHNWVQSQSSDQRIGFLEIHARNNPSLLELCDQLKEWRETAKQNRVPFFAFTMVRQPESFAISYYNYYHGMQWERRRFEFLEANQMTNQNFQRTMHFNPQCLFLTRSEQAYQRNFPEKRQNLTKTECDHAYQCLRATMDWIGTTEQMANETIPLLIKLIANGRPDSEIINSGDQGGHDKPLIHHQNTGPKLFGKHNMSDASRLYLRNVSIWDMELYANVIRDYKYSNLQFPQ